MSDPIRKDEAALTTVPWSTVFGNDRGVEIELGPGRGETLLAAATAAPTTNFFGVERTFDLVDTLLAEAVRRGVDNVRVIVADARCVIAHLVPGASVAAYHIYFPDPWPKRRQRRRRLVSRAFAPHLARTLAPGGALHLATDVRALLEEFAAHLVAAGLERVVGARAPHRPMTTYERRYAREGTYYARFTRGRTP